jgi:hypothetical protein
VKSSQQRPSGPGSQLLQKAKQVEWHIRNTGGNFEPSIAHPYGLVNTRVSVFFTPVVQPMCNPQKVGVRKFSLQTALGY